MDSVEDGISKKWQTHHEPQTKSPTGHFRQMLDGGIATAIGRFAGQPFDVMKVRFQLQKEPFGGPHSKYRSMAHAMRVIYKEEGIRGFWQGHNAAQYLGAAQGFSTFWVFEQLNAMLDAQPPLKDYVNTKNFVAGFASGFVGVLVFCPMELIKTRLIAKDSRKLTIWQAFTEVVRHKGYRGLYKGCAAGVLQVAPLLGAKFMFYHWFCHLLSQMSRHAPEHRTPAWMQFVAGGASGIVANTILYPMDVVKRRLQIQGFAHRQTLGGDSSCAQIGECLRHIWAQEGIQGMFKGMKPCLLKSCLSSAVQFTVYGQLQSMFV